MPIALMLFEVMDKELPLSFALLFFLSIGGAGMLMGRRRPLLCVPFFAIAFILGFIWLQELNDAFVGPAIREEGGLFYVVTSYAVILAGMAMPLLGAVLGARQPNKDLSAIWRWISGLVGLALFGLATRTGYGSAEDAYYNYYLYPKIKAEDHYVMPLRWQDVVAQVVIWSIVISLLICSVYFLRSAFRPKEHSR